MAGFDVTVKEVDAAPFAEKARAAWPALMSSIPGSEADLKVIQDAKGE